MRVRRFGQTRGVADTSGLADLGDDHPVWEVVPRTTSRLFKLPFFTWLEVSPEKIVLSGGVMLRASLFPENTGEDGQILEPLHPRAPAVSSPKSAARRRRAVAPRQRRGHHRRADPGAARARGARRRAASRLIGGVLPAGAFVCRLLREPCRLSRTRSRSALPLATRASSRGTRSSAAAPYRH